MTPNPQPPTHRGLSDVLSPQTRRIYDESQRNLKIGMIILDVLIVLYTLPHNLHAFGIGWKNILATLGVATIEGVFVLATSHFIFGLISTRTQRNYAYIAIATTAILLMSNSVLSQLLYLQEAGKLTANIIAAVTAYQGFILPLTPVLAFICGVMLMAHHPKIVESGRTMAHVASVTASEQSADRERQTAVAEMHSMRTTTETAKLRATLEAEQMTAEVKLRQYQLEVQEKMATVDFEIATTNAIIGRQISRMNEYLDSEQFDKRIHSYTTQKVGRTLKRLEDALAPEQPAQRPQAIPANIEVAAQPQPVPDSYRPTPNGHYRPNPTGMGD